MTRHLIGHDWHTGKAIYLPQKSVWDSRTHFWLLGQTGKGKTTALKTMLIPLFQDWRRKACFFIIDPLGLFADELMMYIASEEYCPPEVRDRVLYIEPSNSDYVLPFHPLASDDPKEQNFRIHRTKETTLRAWESQDLSQMARLENWLQFSFEVAAELGLTIADVEHILYHGSEYHADIVSRLSDRLRMRYQRISKPNTSSELILDSTRNRLDPYFTDPILRRTFGSLTNCFDAARFIEEGRIIIVNLKSENRLSPRVASTIGSLMLNEIMATARALRGRFPIYLALDEFQNFVGPDLSKGIAELRQFNVRLIMSHQSLSQLKRGDDESMLEMVFQAQNRMIFGVSGRDADVLAEELAVYDYDPKEVKHLIMTARQRKTGRHIETLRGWTHTVSHATGHADSTSRSSSDSHGMSRRLFDPLADWTSSTNNSEATGSGQTTHSVNAGSDGENIQETFVEDIEDFEEIGDIAYVTYDERRHLRRKIIQSLHTGRTVMKLNDDPTLYELHVKQTLGNLDLHAAEQFYPEALRAMEELKKKNFLSDVFRPSEVIDAEIVERLARLKQQGQDDGREHRGESPAADSPFPVD